ncbi:MAG: peptidoglycan editing factor PgeF [Gammaproteobacteria bacterium]
MSNDWIVPDWPAPVNVRAVSSIRTGGVSRGVYASLNLGGHVGDDSTAVAENRRRLLAGLSLRHEPRWLNQVHGAHVVHLNGGDIHEPAGGLWGSPQGDAAVAQSVDEACVIMTADCLPVLFCDRAAKTVAAAHAGWRGLAAGVLEAAVAAMRTSPDEVLAWLGPAIGPEAYEVGEEVRAVLIKEHPQAEQAFESARPGKWLCDLYLLASLRLRRAGITHIYGGGFCTFSEHERFFSYRRHGECGRMATLIWLASSSSSLRLPEGD